jgi:hypothetical protein
LPLGASLPATIEGTLDDEQFSLHLKGDATIERLQQLARAFGVGAPKIALVGPATVDLVIGGKWAAFTSPDVSGTALLKNARAEVPGLLNPVEIASARVTLDSNRFVLRDASATIGKVSLGGSASFPRSCDGESPCQSSFDLSTDDLNPERWNEVLNPRLKKRPWYRLFGAGEAEHNLIANLHSTGHLTSRHLTLGLAAGSGFETDFSIADGVLELKNTRAELLGGSVSGEWKINFLGNDPKYESSGTVQRLQAEKLGTLLKAPFGSGLVGLKYKLEMAGWDAATLAQTAAAETKFDWSGGALRISLDGKTPLRVLTGEGQADLDQKGWTILHSRWQTPAGTYRLTGSASRDLALALEFTQENGAVSQVTGTLLKPQLVASAPQSAQAKHR